MNHNSSIKPLNLPETVVWYYLIGTYVIYLIGGQYIFTAFMGTFLLCYLARQWWRQTPATPMSERIVIAPLAWAWFGAMLMVELALIVGHLNFNLGMGTIIKSSSHWYRTWAIFGIFPLVGHLNIRPQIIYRGICILCLQSIIVVVAGTILGSIVGPELNYVSPLIASGGDEVHYTIQLVQTLIDNRLELFSPWSTTLGMAGNTYLLMVTQESDRKWRTIGIVGSVMMIIFSWSRLAIVSLFFVPLFIWMLSNLIRPWMQFASSIACFLSGIFFAQIVDFIYFFQEQVNSLREDTQSSSNTRKAIYKMTLYLWRNDAPIWGHGITPEKGPGATDYYPVASHQAWYYLLYAHGLVGFIPSFLVAVWTLISLIVKAQSSKVARVCLGMFLVIVFNSFTDNTQSFAYMCWPSLLMMGIFYRQEMSDIKSNKGIYRRTKMVLN